MSELPPPSPALLKFLRQAGAHPIRNGLLIAFGAALSTLGVPLFLDDFLLLEGARLYLEGSAAAPVDALGLPDLFVFLEGGGQDLSGFAEPLVPWWTSPETRLAFWRPISSLLVLFDVAVLQENATALHAHSLFWYLGLVGAVGLLYRELLPRSPRLQAVALSIFAMEDAHWLPIGWASNRNALVAGTFGVLAVWAHVRWRRRGWTLGAVLAPLLLGLALPCSPVRSVCPPSCCSRAGSSSPTTDLCGPAVPPSCRPRSCLSAGSASGQPSATGQRPRRSIPTPPRTPSTSC